MLSTGSTPPWANSAGSLTEQLSRHGAIIRILVGALFLTAILISSRQSLTQAGAQAPTEGAALSLPASIGVGIPTNQPVTIEFSLAMDPASVAEALVVEPATDVFLTWSEDATQVQVTPSDRWETDRRYLLTVGPQALAATGNEIGTATELTFTTQTAPAVRRFEVATPDGAEDASQPLPDGLTPLPGYDTSDLDGASTRTTITVEFTRTMERASVEDRFVIEPYVRGSFAWEGDVVSFVPDERLVPDSEYTVSLAGATDLLGNPVGREAVFTFTTQPEAAVVRVEPAGGSENVTSDTVTIQFSHPMDVEATNESFGLWDIMNAATKLPGEITWNEERTELTFVAAAPLGGLRLHAIRLGDGATDLDGNLVTGEWRFWTGTMTTAATTAAAAPQAAAVAAATPPPPPAYSAPAYAPGSPLEGYALQQINSARAAYGFPPLTLDPAVSAAASAHAWDQLRQGYYSHTSLDGRTQDMRLRQAGASFGLSGENQCHHYGMSALDTLNWCHEAFMAEPWPGHWNHIGNILGPDYTRVGIGIADGGGRVVITWDFVQ